jgi:hypothetical protein
MSHAPITQGYSFATRRKDGSLELERAADNINVLVFGRVKDALMDLDDMRGLGMDVELVRVKFRKPVIVGPAVIRRAKV